MVPLVQQRELWGRTVNTLQSRGEEPERVCVGWKAIVASACTVQRVCTCVCALGCVQAVYSSQTVCAISRWVSSWALWTCVFVCAWASGVMWCCGRRGESSFQLRLCLGVCTCACHPQSSASVLHPCWCWCSSLCWWPLCLGAKKGAVLNLSVDGAITNIPWCGFNWK